jgi:hypothetical protein
MGLEWLGWVGRARRIILNSYSVLVILPTHINLRVVLLVLIGTVSIEAQTSHATP